MAARLPLHVGSGSGLPYKHYPICISTLIPTLRHVAASDTLAGMTPSTSMIYLLNCTHQFSSLGDMTPAYASFHRFGRSYQYYDHYTSEPFSHLRGKN